MKLVMMIKSDEMIKHMSSMNGVVYALIQVLDKCSKPCLLILLNDINSKFLVHMLSFTALNLMITCFLEV